VELRADELGCDELVAIDLLEKAAHERCLACADLAGDDDEPLALIQAVLQIRECALVATAAEIERGIRVELKGLTCQSVESFVHGGSAERVRQSDEDGDFVVIVCERQLRRAET